MHMAAFSATSDSNSRDGIAGGMSDADLRIVWLKQLSRVCIATFYEAMLNVGIDIE